jgi:hypothetical protein
VIFDLRLCEFHARCEVFDDPGSVERFRDELVPPPVGPTFDSVVVVGERGFRFDRQRQGWYAIPVAEAARGALSLIRETLSLVGSDGQRAGKTADAIEVARRQGDVMMKRVSVAPTTESSD